jgi:CHAT domain-containing protein/tetratricopeptide (TPR) repeat protein
MRILKTLIAILFIFIYLNVNSQNKLDSLVKVLQSNSADTNEVKTLLKIYSVLSKQNKIDSSLFYVRNALDLSIKLHYLKGEATSHYLIGQAYQDLGRYSEGIKSQEAAITIYEKLGDKKGLSGCYNDLGSIYCNQGKMNEGLDYFKKTLAIREELNEKVGIAGSLNNIGIIYYFTGVYDEAIKYFSRAIKIKEELGQEKLLSSSYGNLGLLYSSIENYSAAHQFYLKALAICEKYDNKKEKTGVLNNIGNLYRVHGNLTESLNYHNNALKNSEEIEDKIGIASSYSNLAITYLKMQNNKLALEYNQKSIILHENLENKQALSNALLNLGVIKNSIGQDLTNPDSVLVQKDLFQQALEHQFNAVKISEELNDKGELPIQYINLAISYLSLNNYEQAIKYSHKTLREVKTNPYANCYNLASRTLFIIYTRTDQLDSASYYLSRLKNNTIKELNANYFTLSENEKSLYYKQVEQNFGKYYDFSVVYQNKYPFLADTSYNLALVNKSFSLNSSTLMRQSILNSTDSLLIQEYESWLSLKNKLSKIYSINEESLELEKKANEIEKQLVQKSQAFSDFDNVRSLDWKKVQKNLKKDEAAIEFVHYKSELDSLNPIKYSAFVITKKCKHPYIFYLCNEKEIENILDKIQSNDEDYVNAIYGKSNSSNTLLYDLIWKPLLPAVKGIKTIYYSPSGLLNKISFAALHVNKKIFLCDNYNLIQQGSTGNITRLEKTQLENSDKFLLMGGIKYERNDSLEKIWNYLPGTMLETKSIEKILSENKYTANLLSSEKATETNFKDQAKNSEIIHVATHGFFFQDPEEIEKKEKNSIKISKVNFRGTTNYANWSFVKNKNPLMRSGIVFANANEIWSRDPLTEGDDGVLTALEVSGLNLSQTKLVVLSACETGLGDIQGSEGVYGLQRAFKIAGAKNLIMSLWQVPDKETEEFMITFYQELNKSKEIQLAFSNTQKLMRVKYDPYFWGAFVLIE